MGTSVAYIRIASKDNDAVETQKSMVEQYAKSNGYVIRNFYIDNGFSGISLNRPQLNKMLSDINKGNINTIIIKSISVLSRDINDSMKLLKKLKQSKIKLIALDCINNKALSENFIDEFFKMNEAMEETLIQYRKKRIRNNEKCK